MHGIMRIFKLYDKAKPDSYVAYVADWEVARKCLAMSYSAFNDVKMLTSVNGITVQYVVNGSLMTMQYGLEPIDLLTSPQHL